MNVVRLSRTRATSLEQRIKGTLPRILPAVRQEFVLT
jgi:hypothetical protein